MQIYERIKKYMAANHITQRYLAAAMDYSEPTISGMLNGRRQLYADELAKICQVLDVPATTFIPDGGSCHDHNNKRVK